MSYRVLNLRRLNEIDSYGFTPDQLDRMLDEEVFDWKEEFEKTGNEKYILDISDHKQVNGHTLYRIIYKDGSKGGYAENYHNLRQDGNCKVLDNAMIYNALVKDNAKVYGNAKIYGRARIYDKAQVYGNAEVYGNDMLSQIAKVYGNAKVFGDAKVNGDAEVYGNAKVYDDAWVYGDAKVFDNAEVYGNAWVCGDAEVDYDVSEGKITE